MDTIDAELQPGLKPRTTKLFRSSARQTKGILKNNKPNIHQGPYQTREKPIFSGAQSQEQKSLQTPLTINIKNTEYDINPYKSGGICQIYRGVSKTGEAPDISVKVVQNKWRNNSNVRRQFSIESQIVRELNHPSVPNYLCRGISNNQSYYAYEFIDGIQLINLSQRPDLFPKNIVSGLALNIVKQVLKSLDFLHTRLNPIAHGDISSENILINHQQNVFLLDFGCAHHLKMHGFNAKKWVGKPSFISPEQARGKPWDHRSDLYQVGILYYELLTGSRWNRGATKESKYQFAANAPSPCLNFLVDSVSIPVSMILAKMLHPDPTCRFQSASEILSALNSMRRFQPKKSFLKM